MAVIAAVKDLDVIAKYRELVSASLDGTVYE